MLLQRQGERQTLIDQLDLILQGDIAIIIDEIHEIAVEIKAPKYLNVSFHILQTETKNKLSNRRNQIL